MIKIFQETSHNYLNKALRNEEREKFLHTAIGKSVVQQLHSYTRYKQPR